MSHVDTERIALACELCRLLKVAMHALPHALIWVGHEAAYTATIGPHQTGAVGVRCGEPPRMVDLIYGRPDWRLCPGLWARFGRAPSFFSVYERLDSSPDSAIRDLALRLLAPPTPPTPMRPPADVAVMRWTHAHCLLCNTLMRAGSHVTHFAMAHQLDVTADLRYVGREGEVYEFNNRAGRAVLWLWREEAITCEA
jgi:hypothetical protein